MQGQTCRKGRSNRSETAERPQRKREKNLLWNEETKKKMRLLLVLIHRK